MSAPCKHPQVRIVCRDEESEFVECQTCREVFDSQEFADMQIEDTEDKEREAGPEAAA